jgi:hypothetical protein
VPAVVAGGHLTRIHRLLQVAECDGDTVEAPGIVNVLAAAPAERTLEECERLNLLGEFGSAAVQPPGRDVLHVHVLTSDRD